MTGWDENAGRVSRAFNEWFLIDRDQRQFLHYGLLYITETLERVWDAVTTLPPDEDGGSDAPDLYEAQTGGLYPQDVEWMHCAGVLKDAVTNFEVYLEKAREEVRRAHGHTDVISADAPFWRELQQFYGALGVTLPSDAVRHARDVRHVLTHRRGELRTDELRAKFAPDGDVFASEVALDEASVVELMDVLAAETRSIDVHVYEHTWGGKRLPDLLAIPVDD